MRRILSLISQTISAIRKEAGGEMRDRGGDEDGSRGRADKETNKQIR